jgi:serine protease Do
MQIGIRALAAGTAGLFIVGTFAAWSAPAPVPAGNMIDGTVTASVLQPAGSAAHGAIPPGAAPDYRAIAAQNRDAVVGITVRGHANASSSEPSDSGDDSQDPNPGGNRPTHALGSGFIVSPDGLILTNAHVVEGAEEVTVKLADHREFKAKVLGADHASDIAVIKIDAQGLPTVRFGNSDQLRVGDYVLAIGTPFGLEETATAGIVSAKGRSLPGDGSVPFIQIDAAVNPGNSGGPLFDSTGAVVGINSQIYSSTGGYQGVAFAIPINLAVQVRDQIVKTGRVEHGRLGVEVQTVDQSLADSFRLSSAPSGALVSTVEPDSAAAQAGLKAGDVILKYNGISIADAGQLSAQVSMATPGDIATLALWRDGQPLSVAVSIGSPTPVTADDRDPANQPGLGLALRPLTPDERSRAGVTEGLVVEDARGRAAEAGIQPGDLVLSVDGTPVQSVAQLRELVHTQDKQIALLIQRGDNRLFVAVSHG